MSNSRIRTTDEQLHALAPASGVNPSALPGVVFQKITHRMERGPAVYQPGLKFVCRGCVMAHLGTESYLYGGGEYLLQTAALPVECEIDASLEAPVILLLIDLDPILIGEILQQGENGGWTPSATGNFFKGMCTAPMTPELGDAVTRLLGCLRSPLEAQVLGRGVVREILFRVLGGEHDSALAAAVARRSGFARINRSLGRLNRDYRKTTTMESLAKDAHMSVSAFHRAFKEVTSTTPFKYLQSIRLHKARAFLMDEEITVAEVAERVGYASVSQFSREFRRLFGESPARDAGKTRGDRIHGRSQTAAEPK